VVWGSPARLDAGSGGEPPRVQTLLANCLAVGVTSSGPSGCRWTDGMVPGGRRRRGCRCVRMGSRDPQRDGPSCQGGVPQGLPGDAPATRWARCSPTSSSPSCSRPEDGQPGHRRGWHWCWCWEFVEGLTDRQAANAVRARLDWNYALGLDLCDPGFDASVLTEFRPRRLADGQAGRPLELMLARLREQGLSRAGGRQRTDATTSAGRCVTCTGWSGSSRRCVPRWRLWRWWRPPGWAGCSRPSGSAATASAATTGGYPRPSRPASSGPSRSARTAWCC
jgi:Transposase domain (DUF772)